MTKWLSENRQTIVRVLGSILALVLLIILLQEEGDGKLFSALRRVSIGYFLAAIVSLFISRLFAVARWHILLRSAGVEITFLRSVMLTFTGNFSSNFLPTTIGGDVVRLGGAMQLGYDRAICVASLVADRLIGLAGMSVALPLGLVPVFSLGNGALQSVAVSALVQKGVGFAKRTFDSFSIWLKKPFALSGSLLATFGNMAFIYLAIYLLLLGIDHHISYWLVAGLYTLTYFVTLFPVSINGLGVQELSMTFLLTQLGGLSSSESATVALLTRVLFIVTSLPGAFFLPSILAAMNNKDPPIDPGAFHWKKKEMKPISPKIFWQTFIGSSVLLSLFAIYQTTQQILTLDINLWHSKWTVLLGVFALNIVVGLVGLRQLSLEDGARWVEKLEFNPAGILVRSFGFILIVSGFTLPWVVRLFFFGGILPQVTPIFWIFLWASLVQVLGLKIITGYKWHTLFVVTILVQGLIYQTYGHLTIVSDDPFSIGYSEASRHYYASLFFARSLYESPIPLPFLHPTRYFLMSTPFLFAGLPLWFHRLWQALLWIGLTAASSIVLTRRLSLKGWMQFLVASWAFLYFLQGAVYYHLQVIVIIVLAGVSVRHPRRSLLFVVIASIWAGASRVNWFPVPAMLAIAIYVLETSFDEKGWRYWLTPFRWGISGLAAAIASQFIYVKISENADIRTFGSSFTSDLIWNRLLPNNTFPLGILLGIAIISAPLVMAMAQMTRGKFSHLHPLRWGALLGILLVLFLGGLVVSVKIGGGADLHNMDAFLVLLALITLSFFSGCVASEELSPVWGQVHWPVMAAILLVPLGFALPQIGFFHHYDSAMVEKDVQKLQESITDVLSDGGGEVLFVTERQLLTFDTLRNIPLVPEYEQIELMEMAMSENREYLEAFYSDLRHHRFDLIIAEEQKFTNQKKGPFIEENNAWVRYVGAPLLCAYKPVESLSSTNVRIFIPRPAPPSCKDPFLE